jgi:hypothetical protein
MMFSSPLCIGLLISALAAPGQRTPDFGRSERSQALEVWQSIKRDLSAPDGLDYWENNIKDALIPGGAAGVNRFPGFVISSKPSKHPNVIVLGILDNKVPEVELRLVDRRRNPVLR